MRTSSAGLAVPPDDEGMNLTPMIDVVFQLLVFFLLSLRFQTVDERVETQLPEDGFQVDVQWKEALPTIEAKLFRRGAFRSARTVVRLGGETFDLPAEEGPPRTAALERVRARIESLHASQDRRADTRGEIATPLPSGARVPHGDVMAVLDAYLRAGVTEVVFEGAPVPLRR